ncbi:MAG: photosystem P840 reaction-center cytochrome c-551 [Nitrospiraceae bacterium]|jgi:cytochrome c5|nr:photosystem P840 reaction-center cytochrome c-551 [Nitrospirota bacterium]MDA8337897.1 photosystem P840 reaction-center cytochrome c-551 [Nitrospiraceae bacterium]
MKKLGVSILGITFLVVSGMSVSSAEKPKVDAKALFEQKCSTCHSIDRPKSKKKTAKEWESTVMRMKNVNGCPITDEEAKIIIDYLSKNYSK